MPQVRKLSAAEVETLDSKPKGRRKRVEEQYDTLLNEFAAGDYGEATLDDGESRLTVRNRLRAAAKRHGLAMVFRRTAGDLIRFHVTDKVAEPAPTPPAAPPVSSRKRAKRTSV